MSGPLPLDARAQGWLRYLYRKATTPDDWDRAGQPHAHWDDHSDPPMLCWHRFDLIDSTYAIGLMADRTPAWREVHADPVRTPDGDRRVRRFQNTLLVAHVPGPVAQPAVEGQRRGHGEQDDQSGSSIGKSAMSWQAIAYPGH